MKFLTYAKDETGAGAIKTLLEDAGIPVVLRRQEMRRYGIIGGGSIRTRIFVCLDFQFTDACELLRNPGHPVSQPVNAAEYHTWAESQPLSRTLVWGSPLVLLGVLIFFILVVWLTGLQAGA